MKESWEGGKYKIVRECKAQARLNPDMFVKHAFVKIVGQCVFVYTVVP